MVSAVCVAVAVAVVVVCMCGVVWHAEIKTSPCVPATRAHIETHARVLPAYTGTF